MKYLLAIAVLCSALFSACKKGPGEGGRASIEGKVYMIDYDRFGNPVDSFYVGEQRVYLIYGENQSFSQEVRTNYDGTYVFEYLLPGDYTVFAYSDCENCPGESEAIFMDAEISSRKEELVLNDLVIEKR